MKPSQKLNQWRQFQAAQSYEANRINFLRTSALPVNDPGLFTPVRCRVLKSFCVSGKPQQIGQEISLPYHLALDMQAIGKIEIIT